MGRKEMYMQSSRLVAATIAILTFFVGLAEAQEFPSRSISLVVGVAPGGPADTTARVLAEGLRSRLKQTVIVENKPGAGTLIGAKYVASAEPDGYTVILGTPGIALFSLVPNSNFDVEKDLIAVAPFGEFDYVLATSPRFSTLAEFRAFGKANPGKLNYASYGPGTQILTRYASKALGIDAVDIPFGGSAPAHTALMAGTVDYIFTDVGTLRPVLESGKGK